eukprot:EG_transcript_7143
MVHFFLFYQVVSALLFAIVGGVPQLYTAGGNRNGQLGDGTAAARAALNLTTAGWGSAATVSAIATGANHTLAVVGGDLYAVGYNKYGQLGDGTTTNRRSFVRITPAWGGTITAIASSAVSFHTLLVAGGQVYGSGFNVYGQLGDTTTTDSHGFVLMTATAWQASGAPTAVAAGLRHSLVLAGGAVFGVGWNGNGQLGDGTALRRLTPVAATAAWGSAAATAIAAGSLFSVVLAGGQIYTTGVNDNGQLGDGTQTGKTSFAAVIAAWGSASVTAIASGEAHTVALAGGQLFAVGSNQYGQLGINSAASSQSTFTCMATSWGSATVTAFVAGGFHTLVAAGGVAYASGLNVNGQLADGTTSDRRAAVLVSTSGVVTTMVVSAMAAGDYHTAVLQEPLLPSTSAPVLSTPAAASEENNTWWIGVASGLAGLGVVLVLGAPLAWMAWQKCAAWPAGPEMHLSPAPWPQAPYRGQYPVERPTPSPYPSPHKAGGHAVPAPTPTPMAYIM